MIYNDEWRQRAIRTGEVINPRHDFLSLLCTALEVEFDQKFTCSILKAEAEDAHVSFRSATRIVETTIGVLLSPEIAAVPYLVERMEFQ